MVAAANAAGQLLAIHVQLGPTAQSQGVKDVVSKLREAGRTDLAVTSDASVTTRIRSADRRAPLAQVGLA